MLTINHLDSQAASELRELADRHGCQIEATSTGFWLWREWTLKINGGSLPAFERELCKLQEDWSWFHDIK